jgi:hypothetical protein
MKRFIIVRAFRVPPWLKFRDRTAAMWLRIKAVTALVKTLGDFLFARVAVCAGDVADEGLGLDHRGVSGHISGGFIIISADVWTSRTRRGFS